MEQQIEMRLPYEKGFMQAVEELDMEQRRALAKVSEGLKQRIPPANLRYEKLEAEPWRSVRLDNASGYRVIFYEENGYRVLCYVGPHDDAYRWAERNKPHYTPHGEFEVLRRELLEQEIPQIGDEVGVGEDLPSLDFERCPLARYTPEQLVALGAPHRIVDELRTTPREELDAFLTALREQNQISEPTYERLMLLSSGYAIQKLMPPAHIVPTIHSAIEQSLRKGLLWQPRDLEELENYLQHPWESWLVFLNATQRDAAQQEFAGPARVTGGPGTGKTIVALHRAKTLVERYSGEKVFLTTFTESLARELERRAEKLFRRKPNTLTIQHLDEFLKTALQTRFGNVSVIYNSRELQEKIEFTRICAQSPAAHLSPDFIWQEWEQVVDAWGIRTEQEYLEFQRVGRGRALDPNTRRLLWQVFQEMRTRLRNSGIMTPNQACYELARHFSRKPPFRCVLVDEAQDFGPAQMALFRALAPADKPDNLFFCVDTAQRIYARSVPWKEYGIDVRGRSRRLRINYRNTLEIQQAAERVLPETLQIELAQLMDDPEVLQETLQEGWRPIPCLSNPSQRPELRPCKSPQDEAEKLLEWVQRCRAESIEYRHIAIVSRTHDDVNNLTAHLLRTLGLTACPIGEGRTAAEYEINIGTAHAIKGLEFRAVAIVAAHQFPLKVGELNHPDTRDDFLMRERNLLYTAMTRPRERLYISWIGNAPLLNDLLQGE
ncbi:MAG: UvrD-helicase domain-containing protein [Fimbriimonadales bacterium]|nr:MAG: DNA helicase [Fimbriimonadales bacterium]